MHIWLMHGAVQYAREAKGSAHRRVFQAKSLTLATKDKSCSTLFMLLLIMLIPECTLTYQTGPGQLMQLICRRQAPDT